MLVDHSSAQVLIFVVAVGRELRAICLRQQEQEVELAGGVTQWWGPSDRATPHSQGLVPLVLR